MVGPRPCGDVDTPFPGPRKLSRVRALVDGDLLDTRHRDFERTALHAIHDELGSSHAGHRRTEKQRRHIERIPFVYSQALEQMLVKMDGVDLSVVAHVATGFGGDGHLPPDL